MNQDESANERIGRLGERLIQVLEQEDDPALILSALALVSAAGCGSMAGEATDRLETVAHGFVRIFLGVIARDVGASVVIH